METVTITSNVKLIRMGNAILGIVGLLLTCHYGYSYVTGSIPNDWFLYLPITIWAMVRGLGRAFGFYDLSYSQISLDKNRLSVTGQDGGEIDFDKLSWIRLKKSRVEFKIQWSGYNGYFRIPWNFRIKSRIGPLKKALQERCRHQGIEFESEF